METPRKDKSAQILERQKKQICILGYKAMVSVRIRDISLDEVSKTLLTEYFYG